MWRYILKRIVMLIPVLLGVTFVVFFILSLTPGDPVEIILGDSATTESIMDMREELGLNENIFVRYLKYIGGVLRGDFGLSYKNRLSVASQILERFPNTLLLALIAIVLALIIGLPIGIISAKKQNTIIDNTSMIVALLGISMPIFWLGLVLVIVFSLNLRIFPSSGMNSTSLFALIRSLVLPSITLCAGSAAVITRMTRSSMLEVIRQDYIDTARSKGVKESVITIKHMLKNALIPIITVVGLQFGNLLGGAVVTETIFSWPGIGRFTIEAIKMKDTPTVLGCVIFMSVVFTVVNLVIDILYAYVDPRIKSQYSNK